jgi:riboflavin kinase / FMN adenylyltransferase
MNIYNAFKEIDYNKNTVLTVGTFDGVHKGHQMIINRLLECSQKNNQRALLLTIDPHPQIILRREGKKPVKLLTMINERLKLFEKFGLENVLIIPFTFEFSRTSPEIFVSDYLSSKIGFSKILIGYDHMFGKDREGNEDLLKVLGDKFDFQIEKIDPLNVNALTISSTKIRHALENKQIELANDMLGYNYMVSGTVIRGDGRGAKIGIPTANIQVSHFKQMPGNGVYLVRTELFGKMTYGMANIGIRPTFTENTESILEVNFFDFNKDLYRQEIDIEFLNFLRDEKKFDGLESFLKQLANDKINSLELINKFYN